MFRFRLEGQGKLSENLEVSQGKGLLEAEERACESGKTQQMGVTEALATGC